MRIAIPFDRIERIRQSEHHTPLSGVDINGNGQFVLNLHHPVIFRSQKQSPRPHVSGSFETVSFAGNSMSRPCPVPQIGQGSNLLSNQLGTAFSIDTLDQRYRQRQFRDHRRNNIFPVRVNASGNEIVHNLFIDFPFRASGNHHAFTSQFFSLEIPKDNIHRSTFRQLLTNDNLTLGMRSYIRLHFP